MTRKLRISYDFDDCLGDLPHVAARARQHVIAGHEVFILTARCKEMNNVDVLMVAEALGIPGDRILMCCDSPKRGFCARYKIDYHFDDSLEDVNDINAARVGTTALLVSQLLQ
jgi:hypothetical protein